MAASLEVFVDGGNAASADATVYGTLDPIVEGVKFPAGKNRILNSNMEIWQRGTSFNVATTPNYTADRIYAIYSGGTSGTCTVSRQAFTPGTAPGGGYESTYFLRYAVTTAGSGYSTADIAYYDEDVRVFAGQTITFSLWAKADAARTINPQITQYFGSGGSGTTYVSMGNATLTTTWKRYTFTATVPSITGQTIGTESSVYWGIEIFLPVNTTYTIDVWGLQAEAGDTATPYTPAMGGNRAAELAACQRYYLRYNANSAFAFLGETGSAASTTQVSTPLAVLSQMRIYPALEYGGAPSMSDAVTRYTGGTWTVDQAGTLATPYISYVHGTAALTQFRPYRIQANNDATTYVAFSAEI